MILFFKNNFKLICNSEKRPEREKLSPCLVFPPAMAIVLRH